MITGFVHGAQVDGHFFDAICNFYQAQIHDERNRANSLMAEMAEHIPDETIADKYREQAVGRPVAYGTASIRSGPVLSMGRGRLCQTFLDETDDEWLFCSDTDMVWAPDLPQTMIRLAEQGATLPDGTNQPIRILAAPAYIVWYGPDGSIQNRVPNVFFEMMDGEGKPRLAAVSQEQIANNGFYPIGACGGALMLIHRDALINVRDNLLGGQPFWWHHLPTPPIMVDSTGREISDQYGEDTSFCIRAREAGETIWLHSGLKVGHSKARVEY